MRSAQGFGQFPALRLGWLIVSIAGQAQGAPIIDRASMHDDDGHSYRAWAIHLRPWRRNRYGDREADRALFIGWRR